MDFMCDHKVTDDGRMFFFVALYPEAKPLIRRFSLKKKKSSVPFDQYVSPDNRILLVVTGGGAVSMATAVGAVLASEPGGDRDLIQLVNWGCCGAEPGKGKIGEVYLCCKITEESTGRDWYPDVFSRGKMREAVLISADRLYRSAEEKKELAGRQFAEPAEALPRLHDMEGAAFFRAASFFEGPHQIHVVKVVSDQGDSGGVTKQSLEELMQQGEKQLFEVIPGFKMSPVYFEETAADFVELERELDCSETMRHQIRELVHYARLTGWDMQHWLDQKRTAGQLPCKRKQGKHLIEELRGLLDGSGS